MKHFCTLAMTRATELFQIVSEKSRVSLQGTVSLKSMKILSTQNCAILGWKLQNQLRFRIRRCPTAGSSKHQFTHVSKHYDGPHKKLARQEKYKKEYKRPVIQRKPINAHKRGTCRQRIKKRNSIRTTTSHTS